MDLLRRAGRKRYPESTATTIHAALGAEHLSALPTVTEAFAASASALVAIISTLNTHIATQQSEIDAHCGSHPDAEIYLSQPGPRSNPRRPGARRVRRRPTPLHQWKSTPELRGHITGHPSIWKESTVLARYARNRRLSDALFQQAFAALTKSPGARAYYDAMRARGVGHNDALRRLANRLVGILHGCLRRHIPNHETTAWPAPQDQQTAA